MLASSFDDLSMLVLTADTQALESSMVPKLELPIISTDGIVREPYDTRFQESEEAMTSYVDHLMGKYDNDNTLIISSMTSLTMPSADITGDSNFGTILESKVCVSAVNTSIEQLSKLEASMTNLQPGLYFLVVNMSC